MGRMSTNLKLILEEAEKMGIQTEVVPVNRNFAILSSAGRSVVVYETFCIVGPQPFSENIQLSRNKSLTNFLWEKNNIPIPKYFSFNKKELIASSAEKFPYPIILKETCGKKSINVFPDIKNKEELLRSVEKTNGEKIIIQEMGYGNEYRFLMLQDRLIGALHMVHPFVEGDGMKTIAQLVEEKNASIKNKIILNSKVLKALGKQALSPDSIPEKNVRIYLQSNSCLDEGGEAVDCTDIVHESIIALAAKALATVNLALGGIDLMCEDVTKSAAEQNIIFFEVNSRPSLYIHHRPSSGKPRNVTGEILKHIFKK